MPRTNDHHLCVMGVDPRRGGPAIRQLGLAAIVVGGALIAGCAGQTVTTDKDQAPVTPAGRPAEARVVILGRSVLGRPIVAHVVGDPSTARPILVVGCVHGNETAGEAITRRLRAVAPPPGTAWWLVDELNPDGCHSHTRQNAHGVDLNRNSPWHWRPLDHPGGTYYSGTGPLSEPESRAIHSLVLRLRPEVSIWYHQHAALVDSSSGGERAVERRYSRMVGLKLFDYGVFPGSITTWQDATSPEETAFVVELPPGRLSSASIARHVAAVLALG
jgi:murein peptide amidase A